MNSAGESSVSTSPTSSDSSSVGSEGSDEGDRDSGASSGTASSSEDDDSTNEKLEYTSGKAWFIVKFVYQPSKLKKFPILLP